MKAKREKYGFRTSADIGETDDEGSKSGVAIRLRPTRWPARTIFRHSECSTVRTESEFVIPNEPCNAVGPALGVSFRADSASVGIHRSSADRRPARPHCERRVRRNVRYQTLKNGAGLFATTGRRRGQRSLADFAEPSQPKRHECA